MIFPNCPSLPLANEWREWVRLFTFADEVAGVVAFIRWRFRGSKLEELPPGIPRPDIPPPQEGVGTELHRLIASLGITPDSSCDCESWRLRMNAWGPAGCRAHREEIIEHLRAAYQKTDWLTVLRAGSLAVAHGLPLTIGGMVDLAIERAEKNSPAAGAP